MSLADPILDIHDVSKTFGMTQALDRVSMQVARGGVHLVIGENGAGKSTLMKILSGVHRPDSGRILFRGRPYAPTRPADAITRGVAMIYQEFNLALHLTVAENVLLGREPRRWGLVSRARMHQRCAEALARLQCPISPGVCVMDLRVAERQLVEIARALTADASLIVMDEPTASLTETEIAHLFAVIRRLRAQGVTIIYISHKLEEFFEIGDTYTVLRDGRAVASGELAHTTQAEIIRHMVGRDLTTMYPRRPHPEGPVRLRVRGLARSGRFADVNMEVRAGEVVGIAGLVGAGRSELVRALFGLDPPQRGVIELGGARYPRPRPTRSVSRRIALLSEDRKEEGLAPGRSIAENISLIRLDRVGRMGLVSWRREERLVGRYLDRLRVTYARVRQPVDDLSGGNQQKVALARLLFAECDVLLLDEPTRGIDVGSKVEIYRLIDELALASKAVVVVSSYLPELLGICDSLYVMCHGRLSRKLPIADATPERVMHLATGVEHA